MTGNSYCLLYIIGINRNIYMCDRKAIIENYSIWTAYSAARVGCPFRGKALGEEFKRIVIDSGRLEILSGKEPISNEEFSDWHEKMVLDLSAMKKAKGKKIGVGWAAKILNVFLKTYAYVGDQGRPNIRMFLHPPLDTILIKRIMDHENLKTDSKENIALRKTIRKAIPISSLKSYKTYLAVIKALRRFAEIIGKKTVFELEDFWETSNTKGK